LELVYVIGMIWSFVLFSGTKGKGRFSLVTRKGKSYTEPLIGRVGGGKKGSELKSVVKEKRVLNSKKKTEKKT